MTKKKRETKRGIETYAQLYRDCMNETPQDTINRLRFTFPELTEPDLQRMASRHPDVIRETKMYKRQIAQCRRRLARLDTRKG